MKSTEKKVLKHIRRTLDSIDIYKDYRDVDSKMRELKISVEIRNQIMSCFDKPKTEATEKLKESKEWLDAVIIDNP
jgi:hypothetical protein